MLCNVLTLSDDTVQVAITVLVTVPGARVGGVEQVMGVAGAGTASLKLTVPPAGKTGPPPPIVATNVTASP